jgi:cation diffusion facilitator family transporter
MKYLGGKITRSVSVTSDAYNNLMDAVTTMFAWVGVKISAVGVGEEHPNGHGKLEWIIALLSSASIILVGAELFKKSVNAIRDPEETLFSAFALAVLVISIGVKFFMFIYNKKQGMEKDSEAMKAVSVDCLSDAVSTTVVLLALIVNWLTGIRVDGWCGALVALFIIYNGFKEFAEITNRIMGRREARDDTNEIKEFALKNTDFSDITDILMEDYGNGRVKVSLTAIGKDGIGSDKLLADAANLKYRIFSQYGYLTNINVESVIDENEIRQFVEENMRTLEISPVIKSIRVSNAGTYKLVELDLGIELMNNVKMEEYKKTIIKKMENAPEGYKILTQFYLKGRQRQHMHWKQM